MKAKVPRFLTVFCILLLTGCGSATTAQTAAPPIEEQQAATTTTDAATEQTATALTEPLRIGTYAIPFYCQMAENADDLAAYSNVILEITVSEAEGFREGDLVATAVTPEIIAVHKGDYQGENIYFMGGEMNLKEFYDSSTRSEKAALASSATDEEMQTGIYYYSRKGCPQIQPGERYLFFGTYIESGDYAGQLLPLFEVDGFFACDDDTVYLDREMYNEILRDSLAQQFSLPEKDTDTQLAIDKQALLGAVTG